VTVVDNCDKCEANQVNLKAAPFSKLASLDIGRIKIEYKEVRTALCHTVTLTVCNLQLICHQFKTSPVHSHSWVLTVEKQSWLHAHILLPDRANLTGTAPHQAVCATIRPHCCWHKASVGPTPAETACMPLLNGLIGVLPAPMKCCPVDCRCPAPTAAG